MMRLLKFLAFLLVLQLIGSWVPELKAQVVENCAFVNLNRLSTRDTVRVRRFTGRPGDTVYMPVHMATDSAVAGFQFIFRVDTVKLEPTGKAYDTTLVGPELFFSNQMVGRLRNAQNEIDVQFPPAGSRTAFLTQLSYNPFDSGALLASFFPPIPLDSQSVSVTIDPGRDIIFYIPFIANPTMQHKESLFIRFQESDQFYLDSNNLPVQTGCRRTQIASAWNSGSGITNPTLFPRTFGAWFVADTAPLPSIVAFSTSATNINSGGAAILSWTVTNADSVTLSVNSINILKTTELTSDTIVQPTSTTTYLLTAYNNSGTATASQTITVGTGGGGGGGGGGGSTNYGPDIFRDPEDRTITINQFEPLTIRVTADDENGDSIVLNTMGALPANAAFLGDSTNGTGTVERMFTFTPDASQTGAFTIIFKARDEFGGSSANYLTIVVNPLDDALFTTSDTVPGRRAVGGVPGSSQILFPINFFTAQPIYGIQFDLTFDSLQLEIDSVFTTARTPGFVVYDNIGQIPGVVRVASFHLSGDSMRTDTIPILYAAFSVDSLAPPGLYDVCIKNGFEAIDPNPNVFGVSVEGSCGVLQVDQFGDVNLDRVVNVVDVVNIIGVILGNFSLTPRQYAAGNIVTDANIDVFDMVGILNVIFNIPLVPTAGMEIPGLIAEMSLNYQNLEQGESDVILLDLDAPMDVAGVELVINYDRTAVSLGTPKIPDGANGLVLQSQDLGQGKMKVLLTPTNPLTTSDFIQRGKSTFLEIPITARQDIASDDETQLRLSKALLSTASAEALKVGNVTAPVPAGFTLRQNYPNPFNPSTNIEFSIDVDAGVGQKNVRLDIFNILGQRVKTLVNRPLSTGTFREVWDATNEAGEKVSTGMYLYRLEVGDATQTKKMIFLK